MLTYAGSSEAAVTLGDIMRDNGDASQAVTYYERALSQRDAKYMVCLCVCVCMFLYLYV